MVPIEWEPDGYTWSIPPADYFAACEHQGGFVPEFLDDRLRESALTSRRPRRTLWQRFKNWYLQPRDHGFIIGKPPKEPPEAL